MQSFLPQLLHVPVGEAEQSLPSLPAGLGGPENWQMKAVEAFLVQLFTALLDLAVGCPAKAPRLPGTDCFFKEKATDPWFSSTHLRHGLIFCQLNFQELSAVQKVIY